MPSLTLSGDLMKQKYLSPRVLFLFILTVALAALLLAACSKSASETLSTPTFDPCAPGNIAAEVGKVNDLMREFDDGAQLASYAPVEQLVTIIPSLQEIRRRAEDLEVPSCLETLKNYQLEHMNTVIGTLLLFMQGSQGNSDAIVQGINQARTLHEQYDQEMITLLGVATVEPLSATPTP